MASDTVAAITPFEHATRVVLTAGLKAGDGSPRLSPEDQQALVDLAAEERLLPLLSEAVGAGLEFGDDARRRLLDETTEAHLVDLRLEAVLVEVVRTMTERGIPVRVLKGLATARAAYPDPSLRQTGDVDVLVEPDRFDEACAALCNTGARPEQREPFGPVAARNPDKACTLFHRGLEIDLHWTIRADLGSTILDPTLFFEPDRFDAVTVGDTEVQIPCPELLLLHAALHLATPNVRLSTVADIAHLAHGGRCDPRLANELARRTGLTEVLSWALDEARAATGLPLLFPVLRPDRRDRRPLVNLWLRHRRLGAVAAMASRTPAHQWPRLVAELAWPTDAYLHAKGLTRRGHLLRGRGPAGGQPR